LRVGIQVRALASGGLGTKFDVLVVRKATKKLKKFFVIKKKNLEGIKAKKKIVWQLGKLLVDTIGNCPFNRLNRGS